MCLLTAFKSHKLAVPWIVSLGNKLLAEPCYEPLSKSLLSTLTALGTRARYSSAFAGLSHFPHSSVDRLCPKEGLIQFRHDFVQSFPVCIWSRFLSITPNPHHVLNSSVAV